LEKLIYLIWDHPPEGSNCYHDAILGECIPRLVALDPLGVSVNVDDADSNILGSVALPSSELAVVAQISIWLHAHDFRHEIEAVLAEHGIRRAGYLVTESSWTDYGRNEHHPNPRDWADGERSPGVSTLTLLERPARLDYANWLGHWYSHQGPMPQWMQPRARYIRNTVTRGVTEGAPPYAGIIVEGWPSASHVTDHDLYFGGGGSKERTRRNIRTMVDSMSHMCDMERIRNFAMSEYLIRTPEWEK
jgi:hypothetical protein